MRNNGLFSTLFLDAFPQAEIEAAAAFIRRSFKRKGDGPSNLYELIARGDAASRTLPKS